MENKTETEVEPTKKETKTKENYYQKRKKYDIMERECMAKIYSRYATVEPWLDEYMEFPKAGLVEKRVAPVLMVKMLASVYIIECGYKGKDPYGEVESSIFSRAWDKCFEYLQGKVLTDNFTDKRVWFPHGGVFDEGGYDLCPELAANNTLEEVLGVDWSGNGYWLYRHMVEAELSLIPVCPCKCFMALEETERTKK